MSKHQKKLEEVQKLFGELGQTLPDATQAFGGFLQNASKSGELSAKIKEIIAVSLSVATHCEWCIPYHVKNALDLGATRTEILEACMVAVTMGGGPSLMSIIPVIEAIDEFSTK